MTTRANGLGLPSDLMGDCGASPMRGDTRASTPSLPCWQRSAEGRVRDDHDVVVAACCLWKPEERHDPTGSRYPTRPLPTQFDALSAGGMNGKPA